MIAREEKKMEKIKIVNGCGVYEISPQVCWVCSKNQNGLWALEFVLKTSVHIYSKAVFKDEKDLEKINKYVVANFGIEFVEEEPIEEISFHQLYLLADFVIDLTKDFGERIDTFSKQTEISQKIIFGILEAALDREKGD